MTRKRTTTSRVASSRVVDDFKIIRGIGPHYEKYLHNAGIRTFGQLAKLTPEDVATYIPNLSASQIRKQGWILQARKLASKKATSKPRKKKTSVLTTSQHYENFTVEFLLNEKNKLRRLRIMHVQSGDVETWANWKQEEVSHFLARHTGARIPKEKIQKLEETTTKSKPAVRATKSVKSAKQKTRRRSSTQKSTKTKDKTQPKKTLQKVEAIKAPKVKKDQVRSAGPKEKRSHISAQKSVKPSAKSPSKKITQEPETTSAPKVKKAQGEVTQIRTRQSRSKMGKSVKPIANPPPTEISQKPETTLVPEVNNGQARSVKPEGKQNRSLARKSVDKPITETHLKEISRKSEAPITFNIGTRSGKVRTHRNRAK